MTRTFEYDSSRGRLRATLYIECRDQDGCDATFDLEDLECLDDPSAEVRLSDLPASEQTAIERHAQALADECGPMAWQEYVEGQADYLHDRWRDEQMEQGE